MATLTKSVPTQDGRANFTYTCTVTENSYNTSNNTSNVTIMFAIKGPWAPTFYEWTTSYGIIVDGSVKKTGSSSPYISTSTVQLLTWTGDILHSNDGTKAIKVNVYLTNGSASYLPVQYTSSSSLNMGSVTLTTIPRASTITSASNINLGNACGITFTPASASFYYNIRFSLGSWYADTGLFCPGKTTSYTYSSYAIPADNTTYALFPNSTTGTMTATLTTYSSNSTSAQIGSASSKTFVVTVPNNTATTPKCGTITLTPQTYSYLIQNKNKLTIAVSGCQAGAGSSIKSYTFSGPGIATTTPNTSVTSAGTISNTGTLTYTITVTDTRGRTASKNATITCHAWTAPSITFDAYRVGSNTSAEKNDSGTYIRCTYTVKYSYVNGSNARKSFSISGGSGTNNITYNSWSKTQTTGVNGIVTETGSAIIQNCPIANTYHIGATIEDNYGGQAMSSQVAVFGASRIMSIRASGTGVAFGKMAETENLLESRYKIKAPGIMSSRLAGTGGGDDYASPTDASILPEVGLNSSIETFPVKGTICANLPVVGSGEASKDGYITHYHWYNDTGWDAQLYLRNKTGEMAYRGCNQGVWQDWRTSLDSVNYTNYIPPPISVFVGTTNGTITKKLSESLDNYSYMEIFYTDNNKNGHNSVRIYSPNGKEVDLSIIEASNDTASRTYIRRTMYTIVGDETQITITPNVTTSGYVQIDDATISTVTGSNYIHICKVLLYKS